ncbi:MAG: lysine biosynthesis protein LysX [Sulfolobus sp.]|nr:lysine biosynthesis protein LysX [Sulfolobus sp.]
MRLGILYDIPRWEERNLIEVSKKLGHEVDLIYTKDSVFFTDQTGINDDVLIQRSVSHNRAFLTTLALENLNLRVINDYMTLIRCENKAITTFLLNKHGIPVPRTGIAFNAEKALELARKIGYPVVIKPMEGSWGRMVARAPDEDTLRSFIEYQTYSTQKFRDSFYIQEYVNKPNRDIRVFVIGDEVPVGIYRINDKNWRTNTALGAKAEPLKVDEELRELSLKVREVVGGFFLGIDIFEDKERGYVVDEINGVPEYKNTVRVTDFNVSEFLIKKIEEWVKK